MGRSTISIVEPGRARLNIQYNVEHNTQYNIVFNTQYNNWGKRNLPTILVGRSANYENLPTQRGDAVGAAGLVINTEKLAN